MPAFWRVTWFMSAMALSTSTRRWAWSVVDPRTSVIRSLTSLMPELMAVRASPDCRTRATPSSTLAVLEEINSLISRAESAERWARARTSAATTAKPRPASPARAASTPALRASRLV